MRLGRRRLVMIASAGALATSAIFAVACSTDFSTNGIVTNEADSATDATRADSSMTLSTDSGISDDANNDATAASDAAVVAKRVFVSREIFSGSSNFDDAGAGVCQALANDAGLGGKWIVWHSDGNNDVNAINLVGAGPWTLVNGTLVATRAQLELSPISHAINLDQHGASLSGNVWTGTSTSGVATGFACMGWSSSSSATPGTQGDTTTAEAGWVDETTELPCDAVLHIYCFEN